MNEGAGANGGVISLVSSQCKLCIANVDTTCLCVLYLSVCCIEELRCSVEASSAVRLGIRLVQNVEWPVISEGFLVVGMEQVMVGSLA